MASKITIKRSLTAAAPAGLSFGEMAFVQGSGLTANQLYVGISGGSPAWVGAQIGTTGTWTDTSAQTSLATQYAIEQRISAKISAQTAGVSSFNGLTGAVTGVSSFNGLTGAVSGVTTSVANTFTAVNTFSAGITVSGNLNAVNINTTGSVSINNTPATLTTTTTGNATVFNTVATSLGIGGAATAITMGAQSGTINLRNPTIIVGGADNTGVATITTVSLGNTLSVSPYGSFSISPTSTTVLGGDRTSLIVTNPDDAAGTVLIRGGDLYLGTKTNSLPSTTPVNIVFEGATDNGFETTLTVTDPATADRTITLPDASGTVALTTTVVSSAVAGTGISVSGATGAVTITNIGVQTFNGLTGAVSGLTSGGPLGTPASGTLTNCTGLPISGLAASTSTALGVGTIELGHATDTTLARSGAGVVTIEGVEIVTVSAAQTLTNKTLTGATLTSPSLGTPTLLVGTNITGTASGLTAGTVITNANLTGAITSVGNGTTLGSFSSAQLATALTDETGSGANVFGTSPAITTSLTTPSTSFDLLNTTATTVNFAGGASSALNIGNVGGTATFAGSVIVNGDFTVQGNTTTLNTTTLNVEDFNITMGLTLTNASQCTGAGIGIGVGTGITFAYDHSSLGWLSSVNMDLASGKVFKIANASVLSSSALGAGVTGSSLTQVGTITLGTWNGTAITDTYLAQITTGGKVANSATTATNLNTASAIVARDGSGNFTAGTITAALTGTATNANNIAVALDSSDSTCFITFVNDSSGNQATKVNSTLTYNALSGELSATLIDGGTF